MIQIKLESEIMNRFLISKNALISLITKRNIIIIKSFELIKLDS